MNLSDNELYQLIQAVNKRSMFKSKSDIDYIEYMLRDVGFFRDLRKQIGDALYYQILKELQYECHMPYEPQVQIGDQSNKFYYIIEGKFLILTKSILSNADLQITSEINSVLISRFSELSPQGYLYAGQYFGEQVMMFDQSHTQTILPLEKSHMLVIKRDAYRRIIEYHSRKDDAEKFAFLSGVNLFSKWSAKTLRTLLPDIHEVNFISNQLIYSQGDVVDSVYVIIEGEVQLFKIFNRNPVPMAILGCKEYFGDDEILNQFRTHSARSLSCLKMYRIHKIKFLDHIPFDYSTLNYKDYHRSSQMKKVLSVKNNPTMYMTPVQSDVPLRQLRSESLSILKSPALRQQLLKRKDKNKTTTSLGSFYQVNEMLRKNYRKLDSLIKRESIDLKKTVCSQSPSRKNLRMAFSPSNSQEEISNEGHSRIHGVKFDKSTYLMGQMKLRSITHTTWNKLNNKIDK